MPKPSKRPSSKAVTRQLGNGRPKQSRNAAGQYSRPQPVGFAGSKVPDGALARRRLNQMTLQAMGDAFQRGGQKAVNLVMKQQPAQFLKLCVLTLPRELEVQTKTGPKAMSDDAIAQAIATIEAMLAKRPRAGDDAKLIEAQAAAPSAADDPSASST